MHNAVERELRNGKVDVKRLYRAFNRAAAGQCSNPVHISDKCVENFAGSRKKESVRTYPKVTELQPKRRTPAAELC